MIEGVGRMQPVMPAQASATGEASVSAQAATDAGRRKAAGAAAAVADSALSRIAADMAAAPPVDTAKVTMLREAIAAGSYRPDPMAIAGAMMAQADVGAGGGV